MLSLPKFRFLYQILLPISVLLGSCQAEIPSRKFNGISLVASRDSLKSHHAEALVEMHANSVAIMPYAFVRGMEEPELFYNIERQWFGERLVGIEQAISILKDKDLKIMIKPHIWIRDAQFTGDLFFNTERDWQRFEKDYKDYILLYASIAEKHQIEIFCIGTELFSFVNERPQFWKNLIAEVRKIYKGKLVYAENWDKVNKTEIWESLDYIGVDAYFPLYAESNASKDQIKNAWREHKFMLEKLSSNYRKPILFTEYGYRSIDHALKEPWNSARDYSGLNLEIQALALEVIYEEFWPENWFSGGFLWKWHQHESAGGMENDRFTPQNKPAEKVVRNYYNKFRN